jgi:hypothetical protein
MGWFQYILDHPEMDWNWDIICLSPNITWELIQAHPDKPWNWSILSSHKNITLDIIKANPEKDWNWHGFSVENPNLTWEDVRKEPNIDPECVFNYHLYRSWKQTPFKVIDLHPTLIGYGAKMKLRYKNSYLYTIDPNSTWEELKNTPDIELAWENISKHPSVTWKIIQAHPEKPWDWRGISMNPNITWGIIEAHPEKPWNWSTISMNPNITWDSIQSHPEKPWDWINVSQNPNLSWEIVETNPDKPWCWSYLSSNSMEQYGQIQEEKKRTQERCKVIKEDLMATAWHPRRVEKWLETGGFELLEAM